MRKGGDVKLKERTKEKAREVIKHFVNPQDPSSLGWPPGCTGLFYQPERPIVRDNKNHKPSP